MKRGFTLVELLIVVLIIGLLTGGIALSIVKAQQRGRDSQRIGDLNSMATALNAYYADNHLYPSQNGTCPSLNTPNYVDEKTCTPVPAANYANLKDTLVNGTVKYLQNIPAPANVSRPYRYACNGAAPADLCSSYTMAVELELTREQPTGGDAKGYRITNGEVADY